MSLNALRHFDTNFFTNVQYGRNVVERRNADGVPDTVHHQQGGWSDIHAVSARARALAADAALLPFRSRMRLSQPAAHGTGAVRDVAVQHLTARSARRAGRHFSQENAPLPVNECLRLASTFHSMHAIAGNLTPVPLACITSASLTQSSHKRSAWHCCGACAGLARRGCVRTGLSEDMLLRVTCSWCLPSDGAP